MKNLLKILILVLLVSGCTLTAKKKSEQVDDLRNVCENLCYNEPTLLKDGEQEKTNIVR
jgi:PBP1b-binding outer membrane lipoprotein LpoB